MPFQEMLMAQHRTSDAAFARIEQIAVRKEWSSAATAIQAFPDQTESPFKYEEHVLFPALAAATPCAAGQTSVMRKAHSQIREFFNDLRYAVETHNARLLADATETLLFLMQQHNPKEETVLCPMADRLLSDGRLARCAELKASG